MARVSAIAGLVLALALCALVPLTVQYGTVFADQVLPATAPTTTITTVTSGMFYRQEISLPCYAPLTKQISLSLSLSLSLVLFPE
jgi:uncharacterized lipoprotein YbaY